MKKNNSYNKNDKKSFFSNFLSFVSEISEKKSIEPIEVINALKYAILKSYKNNFKVKGDFETEFDEKNTKFFIIKNLKVVNEINDPDEEILISDIEKNEEDTHSYQVGEIYKQKIPLNGFFDKVIIFSQVKQFFLQKLANLSKNKLFEKYKKIEKEKQLLVGKIFFINDEFLLLRVEEKVKAKIFKNDLLMNEQKRIFRKNNSLSFICTKINKIGKGNYDKNMEILGVRNNSTFIEKLFAREVPRIREKLIEIKSVEFTNEDEKYLCKVNVFCPNENINPIKECIGYENSRIKSISNELNGLKIKIIQENDKKSNINTSDEEKY
jgi:N utilization substance protein A